MPNISFLFECHENGTLQALHELNMLKPGAIRNMYMYFKYDAYMRSGHNVNSSVYLTARFFDVSESCIYKVVKKIEGNLNSE